MKKLFIIFLSLIFIAPVMAQGSPPSNMTPLGAGWNDSYPNFLAGLFYAAASITNVENVSTANLIGDSAIYSTGSGSYGYFGFRGTGYIILSMSNGAQGRFFTDSGIGYNVTNSTTASPFTSTMIYSVSGLTYDYHTVSWHTVGATNFYIDAVYIIPGDYPTATPMATSTPQPTSTPYTPVPTATEITFYPTATPLELGTAISEVIAEMTIEVTVILPESTQEPYGVPLMIEGTTGTQDGLFEYRATAGDTLVTLAIVILIVLAIAQLGVMLWKR